jgi:DNA-binding response OmpR family regulator
VTVDLQHQRVIVDGTVVHTTPTEFRIVALLAARNGPVSREEIVREMWGSDYTGDGHACDGHISRLRRKIERLPAFPERLVSVRGVGYELRPL